ncbi:MAG: biotin/lipoyl-binding protein, partial [Clostridia bacterium]
MLTIAFIILAVLALLFGTCIFVFIRNNRDDGDENLYEENRKRKTVTKPAEEIRPEQKPIEEPAAEVKAVPKAETAQQTRRIELPEEESAAPPAEAEDTRVATDAELLSMQAAAAETAAKKAAEPEKETEIEDEGRKINLVPIIAVSAALLLVLCIAAFAMVRHEANKHIAGNVTPPETITATVSNIRQQAKFNGTIECESPEISIFAAGGRIEDVKVKEGDLVSKGDVIYVLDSSNLEERIDLLNQKMKTLTVTEEKTVEDNKYITAYSDGTITKIYASAGDRVTEKTPVAEVTGTADYKVTLTFNADEVAS